MAVTGSCPRRLHHSTRFHAKTGRFNAIARKLVELVWIPTHGGLQASNELSDEESKSARRSPARCCSSAGKTPTNHELGRFWVGNHPDLRRWQSPLCRLCGGEDEAVVNIWLRGQFSWLRVNAQPVRLPNTALALLPVIHGRLAQFLTKPTTRRGDRREEGSPATRWSRFGLGHRASVHQPLNMGVPISPWQNACFKWPVRRSSLDRWAIARATKTARKV